MHQKIQILVWWFKSVAINPQLWSIFGSMIIFDPKSKIIEILESWSTPLVKENIVSKNIWNIYKQPMMNTKINYWLKTRRESKI